MQKGELTKILKPLIKECIKEVIFEEGVLSGIIAEVVKGTTTSKLIETAPSENTASKDQKVRIMAERKERLRQTREKMAKSLGNEAYSGIFEDVEPLSSGGAISESNPASHAISSYSSADAGVDITGLLSVAGDKWGKLRG